MTISCPPDANLADLDALSALPRDDAGPVFRAPWEAQAFAMALELHRRGVFSWPEWAATLAAEIAQARSTGEADDGSRYYERWLAALETLVARKQVVGTADLSRRVDEWDVAARATPHGRPVVLPRR
ncbi:MAG: nitrile hydratase accessory protein [bacterium]|jgi:nitrile hydratase accessory protein|nr:nitrile hydratase accessory protein [Betaproteobacteria bacterium]